jgi:hypothetical protein
MTSQKLVGSKLDGRGTALLTRRRKLCLRMTRVMEFYTLRKQPFAAALTAACQSCAAPFCFHAGTKTVLAFACPLGWLISAFHKTENRLGAI